MSHHFTRRAPKRNEGLSWGRFPTDDGSAVTYRLFRRDHRGALHMEARTFFTSADPTHIAKVLRHAKRQLRDRVDEIDLAAMEQAA
ncbi:hypothetical protein H7691_12615 [Stenotrophomonas sp. CW117]|uniref:hypothetical protein n=1 Tax=Stenotrophomonas TaxID=40323 RepID=UPI000703591D|nr:MULTISPECIES: hypothetical protein [Stenotrophomonas]KRG86147.1 hypothetical protein ABB33_04980 [Stenotrophomonas acidaminiphila]QOF97477.1 hypothetical protein H7691_12615 [Stenotrophomonas sp. CW117]